MIGGVNGHWLGSGWGVWRRDATLAVASMIGGLVLLSLGYHPTLNPPSGTPRALFLVPLTAVCVAVLLRRTTRLSLPLGTGAALADVALGGSLGTLLVYTQVLYDACVYGSDRLWRWLLRISVAATVLGAVVGLSLRRDWDGVALGVLFALLGLIPVLTGISVRQHRDQASAERARADAERARAEAERARAEAERDRAEQTARLAELDRRQAIVAERTRMAREMHDVVANHLSAVAIHATAALSLPGLDADRIRGALAVIRSSSVQGLADMRRMIELLRDPDADDGAGLDRLDDLVRRARDSGVAVRVTVTGTPVPLPVAVDAAAYRILQESLTNVLKHGDGGAEVTVAHHPDALILTVDNPLPTPGRPPTAVPPGAGAGLIGMRERAELLAGSLTAGPTGDPARWRVHALLPLTRPAYGFPAAGRPEVAMDQRAGSPR